MGKSIMFLVFVGLAMLLTAGIVAPASPIMWLAASTHAYAYLRMGIMTILAILLVTNPPRNVIFRIFVGLVSAVLAVWSIEATYFNHMQFMDTLSLLGTSVTMAIVALEYQPDVEFDSEAEIEARNERSHAFTDTPSVV